MGYLNRKDFGFESQGLENFAGSDEFYFVEHTYVGNGEFSASEKMRGSFPNIPSSYRGKNIKCLHIFDSGRVFAEKGKSILKLEVNPSQPAYWKEMAA